jgi:hypothetical protein
MFFLAGWKTSSLAIHREAEQITHYLKIKKETLQLNRKFICSLAVVSVYVFDKFIWGCSMVLVPE